MRDRLHIIEAGDPAWNRWLHPTAHDLYHIAAYHRFHEYEGAGKARLFVYGSTSRFFAWPCLIAKIPQSKDILGTALTDITSVYGYVGPVAFGCEAGDPFLNDGWRVLLDHWREEGVVSVFCRFNPVLRNDRLVSRCPTSFEDGMTQGVRAEGQTVSLDLTRNEATAWGDYRPMWRRHIRRAFEAGIVAEHDQDWNYIDGFVHLYRETMQRNGAAERYYFDRAYIEKLRDYLSPYISLHVARVGNRLAAAVLLSEYREVVQYLYAGVEIDFQRLSPLKLLLHHAAGWARSRGDKVLHLGGGRDAKDDDSLFFFKSGFSDRRHRFCTGRWILDPEAYTRLSVQDHDNSEFFPAYRAQPAIPQSVKTAAQSYRASIADSML